MIVSSSLFFVSYVQDIVVFILIVFVGILIRFSNEEQTVLLELLFGNFGGLSEVDDWMSHG